MFLCVASQFFFIISFFFLLSLSVFMKLFMASAVSRTWCQESWAATFCETHIPFTRTHTEWIARACLCFDRLSNIHACAKFLQPNALCKINWSILCFAIGKRTDDGDGYDDDEYEEQDERMRTTVTVTAAAAVAATTHTTPHDAIGCVFDFSSFHSFLPSFIFYSSSSFSIAHHFSFSIFLWFSRNVSQKIEPLTINHIITLDSDVCLEFCMCFCVLRAIQPPSVDPSQVIQTLSSAAVCRLLLHVYTFS